MNTKYNKTEFKWKFTFFNLTLRLSEWKKKKLSHACAGTHARTHTLECKLMMSDCFSYL